MKATDLAFVSVAWWPKAWGFDEIVRAIVESTAIDPADAAQIAPRAAPCVIAIMETALAKDAVRVLHQKRVSAMAVKRTDIDALRPPLPARRLSAPLGGPPGLYMVEPWRGEPRGLRMADVFLLIRGRITKYERTTTVETHGYYDAPGDGLGPIAITSRASDRRGGREDALDIYTMEGPPVRVSGKFDFSSILGKERGFSDGENMDRLAVKLGEQAHGAEVDLGFREFKPPAGMARRMSVSGSQGSETIKRDDTPLFDFYSAWKAILEKAIRQARQSRANP
jgi:hypothetical protein